MIRLVNRGILELFIDIFTNVFFQFCLGLAALTVIASFALSPVGVRKIYNGLYLASGIAAAGFLIAILTLIVVQMVARWTGEIFPGAPEYAGYSMAAASFLAFANALNNGSHIRVSILINAVPERIRWFLNIWCFGIGAAVGWYVSYYAWQFTYWSWKFSEISQGQDATMLWIPQSAMVIGSIILAIALTDNFLHVILTGRDRMKSAAFEQSE